VEPSEQPTRAVRLLVLDDQSIFRQALLRFFEGEAGLVPVGATAYRDDFYPALLAACPDIVLLDPGGQRDRLPCLVAELRRRCAGVGVIFLTLDFDRGWSAVAPAAGADAFFDEERAVEDLLAAI